MSSESTNNASDFFACLFARIGLDLFAFNLVDVAERALEQAEGATKRARRALDLALRVRAFADVFRAPTERRACPAVGAVPGAGDGQAPPPCAGENVAGEGAIGAEEIPAEQHAQVIAAISSGDWLEFVRLLSEGQRSALSKLLQA